MSKGTKGTRSVAILASDDPAFSQAAKHADGIGVAANAPYSVGEAGMACDDAVTVISNSEDVCCAEKKIPADQLCHDLESLTPMQLRSKYRGEANSHRNMLSREKLKGAVVHDSFRRFLDFLHHVGPKPTKSATLDRIDNTDPEYAPGKVRWADKQTQNRNKGDSLIFTCKTSGRNFTAGQLARKQGVTPAAIRSRRARFWTDDEIIAGERRDKPSSEERSNLLHRRNDACPYPGGSCARITWFRAKEHIETEREELGYEPFLMTPAEIQENLDDQPDVQGPHNLLRLERAFLNFRLPRYWKEYGPHTNFAALRPDQQAWVLRVDPTQGQKLEISERL